MSWFFFCSCLWSANAIYLSLPPYPVNTTNLFWSISDRINWVPLYKKPQNRTNSNRKPQNRNKFRSKPEANSEKTCTRLMSFRETGKTPNRIEQRTAYCETLQSFRTFTDHKSKRIDLTGFSANTSPTLEELLFHKSNLSPQI